MREALARVAAGAAELAGRSVVAVPDADLLAVVGELDVVQRVLAAVQLAVVREVDARGLARQHGASCTAVWLRERLGVSIGAARRVQDLARGLDGLPVVRDALAAGAVSVEQAQAIVTTLGELPVRISDGLRGKAALALVAAADRFDPALLRKLGTRILAHVAPEVAEQADRRLLERQEAEAHRARGFTLSPDGSGGVRVSGRLDAEAAAVVTAALDPLAGPGSMRPAGSPDDRLPGQRRADALVEVCRLALAGGELPAHGGDRPQLVVTVAYDLLTGQLGTGQLDTGQRITPAAVRRLACDARLLPAVLDGAGLPLDVGRDRRLISGALRRALVLRDRGCGFPGCDRPPRWCQAHHPQHWIDGGTTCLANCVLLCGFHHREIHKGDWTVRIAADGLPEFVPPAWIDPTRRPRRNTYWQRN